MQPRRSRVQWVCAAKNNRELEARYDQWAPQYDKDLTEEFEWIGPQVAVELFARQVAPGARILDVGAGRVSSESAWSPPAIAILTRWISPPECSR